MTIKGPTATIHDLMLLQDYFSKKPEPTEKDKVRALKLDDALCKIVDGLVDVNMPLEEILKKILEIMPPKNPA